METPESLDRELSDMREYYDSGKTKEASWRESQLTGLRSALVEKEGDILKALKQDLGKHHVEAFRDEVGILGRSIDVALKSLRKWMAGKEAKLPKIAGLARADIVPEPLGLVLIISSWNFPFGLSLEPLIGAIAAGNTVVLKPSEMSPACSSLLATILADYLDNNAIEVYQGGPRVGEQLLHQKWDKIFFTGSARVGRTVMSAAAQNLTPVTLELGGKCPAVVDSFSASWDTQVAVKRIISAKYGACAGQACIAVDYVLVEKSFSSILVESMKAWIKKMFGENPKELNSVVRIVNKQHFSRLKNLLDDPATKKSVVFGGSMDQDSLFIEPTVLVDPPLESAIMTEDLRPSAPNYYCKIRSRLRESHALEKMEDSIQFIKSRPKPLAIYAFTSNKALQRRMSSETSSGSIIFNDAILQIPSLLEALGACGFGKYHGNFSFDAFSHEKAVVQRSLYTDFWFRYPPWTLEKFQLLEVAYNLDYLGILLVLLGLKKTKRYSIWATM